MFDKYIVSIILGPVSLSLYSIPQQITGKLTVISRAFSSYLLPYLSSGKKELDFKCEKCGHEENITVKGIQNFFV